MNVGWYGNKYFIYSCICKLKHFCCIIPHPSIIFNWVISFISSRTLQSQQTNLRDDEFLLPLFCITLYAMMRNSKIWHVSLRPCRCLVSLPRVAAPLKRCCGSWVTPATVSAPWISAPLWRRTKGFRDRLREVFKILAKRSHKYLLCVKWMISYIVAFAIHICI